MKTSPIRPDAVRPLLPAQADPAPLCSGVSRRSSLVGALMLALVALLPVVRIAQAGPPELMTYQGFLVDANGGALATNAPANYPITFRIYTAGTGGSNLWSEQQIVTVDKGNFSVVLGEGTPRGAEPRPALSSVFAGTLNTDRYMSLSVTIGGSTLEMLPRLRLLPAPYAFTATSASYLAQADGSPVLRYGLNRIEVAGDFYAGGVSTMNVLNVSNLVAASLYATNAGMATLTAGTATVPGLLSAGTASVAGILTASSAIVGGALTAGTIAAGSVAANSVRARGGPPGANGVNSNGFAFSGGGGDIDSGMFSSAEGQVEFHANAVERMRIAPAGVGIGTTTPTATLDVNGSIKGTSVQANSIQVNGTVNATAFTGVFNGEKPPASYTLGTNNLNLWRDVVIDGTALLGDADGGRIKMLIRNHGDKSVRVWVWNFYCENDTDNFGGSGRWGVTRIDGGENFFILGMGNTGNRYDVASIGNWAYIRNYRSGVASGGVDGSAFDFANRYKFYFMLPPNISGTVILYDR